MIEYLNSSLNLAFEENYLISKVQLHLISMREQSEKYILRIKVKLVMIILEPIGEGPVVDEESRRNNKSVMSKGQKSKNSMFFFT